mmetsp:Transcript_5186/g.11375  ORF Transcript_5186/g.11375 Transcript_5186/m.11375 type:complete len:204 (-) Transcript_5186:39-650(-)
MLVGPSFFGDSSSSDDESLSLNISSSSLSSSSSSSVSEFPSIMSAAMLLQRSSTMLGVIRCDRQATLDFATSLRYALGKVPRANSESKSTCHALSLSFCSPSSPNILITASRISSKIPFSSSPPARQHRRPADFIKVVKLWRSLSSRAAAASISIVEVTAECTSSLQPASLNKFQYFSTASRLSGRSPRNPKIRSFSMTQNGV